MIIGDLEGGLLVERLVSGGLDAGRIAWLTTRRILISLCCFFFRLLVGLWLARALVESLSLMHAGDFLCRHLLLLLPVRYLITHNITLFVELKITIVPESICGLFID